MDFSQIHRIVNTSGGILYIMAFMLVVGLTVIIERNWYLRRASGCGAKLLVAIRASHSLDVELLTGLCAGSRAFPQGALLAAALENVEMVDREAFADLIEEEINLQAPHVDARLWVLDTIVTAAPLLGLLGTIMGMFQTFQALGDAGNSSTTVTGGVGEALVATACGLFIALVGLVTFNDMTNRVRLVIHQMDSLKMMLTNRLLRHKSSCDGAESADKPIKLHAAHGA
jgi:biopolymer transport protein ExbB